MSVIDYLDPDEMVAEYAENDTQEDSDVMGVTDESIPCFVPASQLMTCEWCENTGVHPAEIAAVKPENHAIMMCKRCMPSPPEEWI